MFVCIHTRAVGVDRILIGKDFAEVVLQVIYSLSVDVV